MNPLYRQVIGSSVFGTLALIGVIFVSAGTINYWQGWVYVTVAVVASGAYTLYLALHDPALLERRTQAGISAENEPAQKVIVSFLFAAFVALIVLPSRDVRYGLSPVPWYVSIIGNVLVAFSFYVFYRVSKVNTYAAANIRVEEGQKVISTGMYGLVRHPMYFGTLFLIIGTPLALGSWWPLALIVLFLPVLYFRITNEETVLARDLPGYVEYQQKVRYRLVPFVW